MTNFHFALSLGLGSTLAFILLCASAGFAQSPYSIRPDSAGSLLGEETGLEDSVLPGNDDTDAVDEELGMRLRYPELYGGNLATGSELSATSEETDAELDQTLEMQARYPELYLENRLYDEESLLSIDREE